MHILILYFMNYAKTVIIATYVNANILKSLKLLCTSLPYSFPLKNRINCYYDLQTDELAHLTDM